MKKSTKSYLLKMSAAGNRFLIADRKWFNTPVPSQWRLHAHTTLRRFESFVQLSEKSFSQRKQFMKTLLAPETLASTDGLAVLKKGDKKQAFVCDFYNKDGSKAQMCGNLACCLSAYAEAYFPSSKYFQIGEKALRRLAKGGVAFGPPPTNAESLFLFEKKSVLKSLGMKTLKGKKTEMIDFGPFQVCCHNFREFKETGYTIPFDLIDTGVPHGVLQCKKRKLVFEDREILRPLAKILREKYPKDSKEGMNVTFFQIIDRVENRLRAFTFERGVEDFTPACGTGALAVALIYTKDSYLEESKYITVEMPGGELTVRLKPDHALFAKAIKGYGNNRY